MQIKEKRAIARDIWTASLLPLQKLIEQTMAAYTDQASFIQEILGLQRIMEVLSRILQITEVKPDS